MYIKNANGLWLGCLLNIRGTLIKDIGLCPRQHDTRCPMKLIIFQAKGFQAIKTKMFLVQHWKFRWEKYICVVLTKFKIMNKYNQRNKYL